MSQPTLSILICTLARVPGVEYASYEPYVASRSRELEVRANLFHRLQNVLAPQLSDRVELIVESDDGRISVGEKRNRCLARANGQYACFVDDDDLVSEDYVARILKALESGPDCASLAGRMIAMDAPGHPSRPFFHSLKYRAWFEQNEVYYRPPNHLNAVRREIALKVPFLPLNFGEDRDYSLRLLQLLEQMHPGDDLTKFEGSTGNDSPIYIYEYRRKKWQP